MTEQEQRVNRWKMLKLRLEEVPEIVDAVNAVSCCNVFNALKVRPLNDATGAVRLDTTFEPLRCQAGSRGDTGRGT